MALTPEQKEELLRKRAMEFFNDPENFEEDLSTEILKVLEEQLEDREVAHVNYATNTK